MQIFVVDAFTAKPFQGNPAGVAWLKSETAFPEASFMQHLAAELKHSETVFVRQISPTEFALRYFTPLNEVDLCGHATLAAFTMLRQSQVISPGQYMAHTSAGILAVSVTAELIWFEVAPPQLVHTFCPSQYAELYQALGLTPLAKPEALLPQIVSVGLSDILLPVRSLDLLQSAQLVREQVMRLSQKYQVTGVHLYCLSQTADYTAHCRNFAPLYGIDEEAATGTASAALTYSLRSQGILKDGQINTFSQGESLGRPAQIYTRADGQRVQVGGQACLLLSARLYPYADA